MDRSELDNLKKYSAHFGQKVRELRQDRNISQEELADLAGLHRTFVGAVERGEKSISVENAGKIAEALKVTIDTMFRS